MLAGSIHPPFRLNFINPAHLYSSTTLLSSNNERASHLLLLAASKHFSFTKTILSITGFYIKIRASDLPHFEQTQKITNCHSRKKEKKRKEKNLQSLLTIRFQTGRNEGSRQARRRRSLHLSFLDTQNYSKRKYGSRNGSFSRIPKTKYT
jgi:hypothetical protein